MRWPVRRTVRPPRWPRVGRTAGNCLGKTVVIVGAGMLGLTAAAMLRQRGAEDVIVVDVIPQRSELALDFGATQAYEASDRVALAQAIRQATDARGADLVIDMSGNPSAIESTLELLRTGGHLILVGSVFPSRPMALPADLVVRKMLRVEGVHNYTPEDLVTAIQFLERSQTKYAFEQLVQGSYGLSEIEVAVQHAMSGTALRVAIRPQRPSGS